ncbi:hypothetical protein [Streptomyces sp. NPDC087270]|uniref:hypothetical protein n=1 Tax=Streptomyces sp. NPDC087270 TaxID=3365774 RepID=UPI00381974FD
MGQKQEDPGETPEQLKQRATDLRDCARTARKLAGSMGPYLDNAVGQAKAGSPPSCSIGVASKGQYLASYRDLLVGDTVEIAGRNMDAAIDSPDFAPGRVRLHELGDA